MNRDSGRSLRTFWSRSNRFRYVNDDKSLALRELKRLFSRRSTTRLLDRKEVTADTDVRFLEEQSAVWLLEQRHTAGHKAVVAGDRHPTNKIHIHIAILTETKVKR
jgi:hypothetical protein